MKKYVKKKNLCTFTDYDRPVARSFKGGGTQGKKGCKAILQSNRLCEKYSFGTELK